MEHPQTHPQPTCPGDFEPSGGVTSPVLAAPTHFTGEPTRRILASGQVYDVDGSIWDVREARATKHGFDFLYGHPAMQPLSPRRRSRYIVTPALVAYWQANRTNRKAIYALPVGRSTVQIIRRHLGFNFIRDRRALWQTRAADLKKMRMRKFAERHAVSPGKAYRWRQLIVGRVRRSRNWWRDPEALQVLRSNITLREMSETFGISISQVCRVRRCALAPEPEPAPARPLLPWQTPAALEVLRSTVTSRQAAETLGISVGHTQRLRRILARDHKLAGPISGRDEPVTSMT